jgi:hypothetical protein
MNQNNFADMVSAITTNLGQMLSDPDILKKVGMSDIVRVSPSVYEEIKAGGAAPSNLPFGLKVVVDEDLQGEKWELGPKPAASAASEPQAKGPATDAGRMNDPI